MAKRRKYREPDEIRIPIAFVPEWMLGKSLLEYIITQAFPENAEEKLLEIKRRLKEKELAEWRLSGLF